MTTRVDGRRSDPGELDDPRSAGGRPPRRGTRLTRAVSAATAVAGSSATIAFAIALVLVWVVGGFFVRGGFGDQLYQIVVSTVSSIVTFVMVFIIQSSQNRDSLALQAKLDAQAQVLADVARRLGADEHGYLLTRLVGVEDAPDRDIRAEQERVRTQAARAAGAEPAGGPAAGTGGERSTAGQPPEPG